MAGKKLATTQWSLIARAGARSPDGRAALSALCAAYWSPVHAFIQRSGVSADDASDRTQEFFTRLIERNDLAKVDRGRGSKFRSWLLRCVKNYLANVYDHEHTQGRIPPEMLESLSVDTATGRSNVDPSDGLTPEHLYNRLFAETVFDRALKKTRAKYASSGKEALFDALQGCLSEGSTQASYREIAASLGIENTGTVKKAAFDLRARYKKLLYAEVAELVNGDAADDSAVEEEQRQLLAALSDEPA